MKTIVKQRVQFYALTCIASTALFVSACATTPTVKPTVQYQCDFGTQLSVVFNHQYQSVVRGGRGGSHYMVKKLTGATVTLADGTRLDLPAQKVSSGFQVSNGQYTLWGKEDSANWAVGRKAIEQCKLTP